MNERLEALSADEKEGAKALSLAFRRYEDLLALPPPPTETPDMQLRRERHQAWLRMAGHCLLQKSSAESVCLAWSHEADRLLTKAFEICFPPSGTALFALGKLGSEELNLSSDVDLVLVHQNQMSPPLNSLREFQRILAQTTAKGFVLRLDFDLRPGGRQGPLIPSLDHLTDYYGNYGETWERLAFVRLRPLTGDPDVISQVLDFTTRVTYRRHLDYALLEDLKSLRTKIHDEHWKRTSQGSIDLKLGIGGIRDVELFTHALQVIHGGKDPTLRLRRTGQALDLLARKGLLPEKDADFLKAHYWRLRELENYVQALGDEQTHLLKEDLALPPALEADRDNLKSQMSRCDRLVAGLLGSPPPKPDQKALEQKQIRLEHKELFDEILAVPLLSRRREQDERARLHFLERFIFFLEKQRARTEMALSHLRDFLKSTRAKTSFFSLFLREERLIEELAWIFGHSPYLGRLLCFRPELLDAFVFRSQELDTTDTQRLLEDLAEKRMLAEIIEGSRFLRDLDLERTTRALSETADEICSLLEATLKAQFPTPIEILRLGKWGAQEMGFRSDLDFIFVSSEDAGMEEIKYARRFISRLTEAHRGGRLYDIDLRLRPSGKAGPIVIAAKQLQEHLETQAEAWERQAYLRASWLQPQNPFALSVGELCLKKGLRAEDLAELERIRLGLVVPMTDESLDLKYAEGGLVDLELFSQTRCLQQNKLPVELSTASLLEELGSTTLRSNYVLLRQAEQLGQLLSAEGNSAIIRNHESEQNLAALFNLSVEDLQHRLRSVISENIEELRRLDPRRVSG